MRRCLALDGLSATLRQSPGPGLSAAPGSKAAAIRVAAGSSTLPGTLGADWRIATQSSHAIILDARVADLRALRGHVGSERVVLLALRQCNARKRHRPEESDGKQGVRDVCHVPAPLL